MKTYVIYYGEPGKSLAAIPISCEVNLVALWSPDRSSADKFVIKDGKDGKGMEIACFEISLIRAIVDEGERVYGATKVQQEVQRRIDGETVRLVK